MNGVTIAKAEVGRVADKNSRPLHYRERLLADNGFTAMATVAYSKRTKTSLDTARKAINDYEAEESTK